MTRGRRKGFRVTGLALLELEVPLAGHRTCPLATLSLVFSSRTSEDPNTGCLTG